jgi:hypothetical protein
MVFNNKIFLLLLMLVLFSCKQEIKAPLIPVNDFFKLQDKATYRISPDGTCISYLKLQAKKQNLFVENLTTGKVTQLTNLKEKNIVFYSWVSDNELIYYKEKAGDKYQSDLFIIDKEGKYKSFLDYGCGGGRMIVEAVDKGYEVYGVDYGQNLIDLLKTSYPEARFLEIEIFNKNSDKFDIIFVSNVFEHLINPKEIFRQADTG